MKIKITSAAILTVVLTACQTTPPLQVQEFPDGNSAIVLRTYVWTVGGSNEQVVIPAGFYTDYASVPPGVRALIPIHGRYSRAAVIHDYLYWSQGCTREQSDKLLLIAMKEDSVSWVTRGAVYAGVRVGGIFPWNSNASQRLAGLPRVVPADLVDVATTKDDFAAYRVVMQAQGIHDPAFPDKPGYCKLGDTTEIPPAPDNG